MTVRVATHSPAMQFALTYHIEGPRARPSLEIYEEIAAQVRLADGLGFDYAWFAEHHAHLHLGHLPCPLLLALHLAGQTERIHLGTAVICLNMHHPLEVAEQIAVADLLTGGRISPGFGSGSTPEELHLFGLPAADPDTRHSALADSLRIIRQVWAGEGGGPGYGPPLPVARRDLLSRSWVAANSLNAARIAAEGGHNMLFSYLRTPEQYEALAAEYLGTGGSGMIAANRPVHVGGDDASAWREAEPALRILWRRFVEEGKIPSDRREPETFTLDNAPGQFVVGSPETVAAHLTELYRRVPFDVMNIQPRWDGLSEEACHASLRRFASNVMPGMRSLKSGRGAR